LLNFTCKKSKKAQFPRGGTPIVVAQSSAQARHSLARGHKIAKKAPFPRGGTPNVVAQTLLSPLLRLGTASPEVTKSQKSPISARRHADCGRSGSAQFKHTASYT